MQALYYNVVIGMVFVIWILLIAGVVISVKTYTNNRKNKDK